MGIRLWTPDDMTTHTWHDPSDASTLTVVSDKVTLFADKSGNGHDLGPTAEDDGPRTGFNTQNGLNVLDFDDAFGWASLEWASGDFADLTAGAVGFFMIKLEVNQPTSAKSGLHRFGTATYSDHYPYTNGTIYNAFGSNARKTTGNPAQSLAAWSLLGLTSKAAFYSMEHDGTQLYSTTGNTVAWRAVVPYGRGDTTHHFQGQMAEHVIIDSIYEPAERDKVEGYLAWKWGTNLLLPIGHPYYDEAPMVATAEDAPTITEQPQQAPVAFIHRVGAVYSVTAISLLTMTYKWFKDGVEVSGEVGATANIPVDIPTDRDMVVRAEVYVTGETTAVSDNVGFDAFDNDDRVGWNFGGSDWGSMYEAWTTYNSGSLFQQGGHQNTQASFFTARGGSADSYSDYRKFNSIPSGETLTVTGTVTKDYYDADETFTQIGIYENNETSVITALTNLTVNGPSLVLKRAENSVFSSPATDSILGDTFVKMWNRHVHDRGPSGTSNNCGGGTQWISMGTRVYGEGNETLPYVRDQLDFTGLAGTNLLPNVMGPNIYSVVGTGTLDATTHPFEAGGRALRMDGATYVNCPTVAPFNSVSTWEANTFEFWFRLDELKDTQWLWFKGVPDGTAGGTSNYADRAVVYANSAGQVGIYTNNSAGTGTVDRGDTLSPYTRVVADVWYHARLIIGGIDRGMRLYIDNEMAVCHSYYGRAPEVPTVMREGVFLGTGNTNTVQGYMTGYITGYRHTRCVRSYDPASPLPTTDYPLEPYDLRAAFVLSQIQGTGGEGATSIDENRGISWTVSGGLTTTTTVNSHPFATSVLKTNSGWIESADIDLLDFDGSSWAGYTYIQAEGWYYLDAIGSTQPLFMYGISGNTNGKLKMEVTALGALRCVATNVAGSNVIDKTSVELIAGGGWYYMKFGLCGNAVMMSITTPDTSIDHAWLYVDAGKVTCDFDVASKWYWGLGENAGVPYLTPNMLMADLRVTYGDRWDMEYSVREEMFSPLTAYAPLTYMPDTADLRDPPVITLQPINTTVLDGVTASFTVAATTVEGTLTYQWFGDGSLLTNGGPISGAQSTNLLVDTTVADDGVGYYCVVDN
jgi:hypothetical protein